MRKRSSVAEAAPLAKPQDLVPGNVEVADGIVYLKCPGCGLNQSAGSAKPGYLCIKCDASLDGDGVLSPEFIQKMKTSQAFKVRSVPVKQEPLPEVESALPTEVPSKPKCETCGAELTITNLGKFYPCGHDKRASVKEVPPKADGYRGSAKPFSSEPGAKLAEGATVVRIPLQGADTVTAFYGEECYSPRQYQSFRVGPYSLTTQVMPDEGPAQALERANLTLQLHAEREFDKKLQQFVDNLERIAKKMGGQ